MANRFTSQQKAAIEAENFDICVAAGAGAGKTGVLVARFLRVLSSPDTNVDNILVITFTEKATKEMKSRIVSELDARGLVLERRQLETAYVSTIHGFCARALQENPFEAGIDPQYRVLDESASRKMIRDAFEQVIERRGIDDDKGIIELIATAQTARQFGLIAGEPLSVLVSSVQSHLNDLRGAGWSLEKLEAHIHRGEIASAGLTPVWVFLEPFRCEITACTQGLKTAVGSVTKTLSLGIGELIEQAVKVFEEGLPLPDVLSAIQYTQQAATRVRLSGLRQERDGLALENLVTRIKLACQGASEICTWTQDKERLAAQTVERLWSLTARVWRAYNRNKQIRGVLDTDDLQAKAVHLLEASEEVRQRYRSQFRHILVDEFQDTNPLQMRLLELLHAPETGDANQIAPPPNSLFIVGDVQQSIYAFRHAEPGLFREIERAAREDGRGIHISLAVNFRSRPELLKLVEAVFRNVWRNADTPYVPITAGAQFDPKPSPSVEVLLAQGVMRRDYTRLEAEALAGRVQALIEGQEVTHSKSGRPESGSPLRYADVAVLFRSLNDIQRYEEAFARRGVPFYVVGGGRGYYARQEVRDLLNALIVLDTPLDNTALAAILRSPFVGLGAEELLKLTKKDTLSGEKIQGEKNNDDRGHNLNLYDNLIRSLSSDLWLSEEKERCNTFVTVIEEIRRQEDRTPIGHLLERLITGTRYDARLLCRPNGRRRLANVRKLLQMANSEPSLGVKGFIQRLRDLERLSEREGEAPIEEEAADVVRFLTIHSAKGLEFPVVILADLSRSLIFPERALFLCDPHHKAVGTRIEGEPNLTYKAIEKLRQARDREEYERLLYVAMTRAQEHLVLCGSLGGRRSGFNWGEELFPLLGLLEVPPEPLTQTLAGGVQARIAPLTYYATPPEAGSSIAPQAARHHADRLTEAILRGDPENIV